jgi:hypothetical protein
MYTMSKTTKQTPKPKSNVPNKNARAAIKPSAAPSKNKRATKPAPPKRTTTTRKPTAKPAPTKRAAKPVKPVPPKQPARVVPPRPPRPPITITQFLQITKPIVPRQGINFSVVPPIRGPALQPAPVAQEPPTPASAVVAPIPEPVIPPAVVPQNPPAVVPATPPANNAAPNAQAPGRARQRVGGCNCGRKK